MDFALWLLLLLQRSHNRPFLWFNYDVSGTACRRALFTLAIMPIKRAFALLTAAKDSVRRFEAAGKTRLQTADVSAGKNALIFIA